jgi:HK97 family phage prohead protease
VEREQIRILPWAEAPQIRASGAGDRQTFTFDGYAATFGTLSHELRESGVNRGLPFREKISGPEAVADTIAQDDIRFVLDHDMRALLGRTSSGTLRLAADSTGIHVNAELPNTSYARDYAELVQRGDAGEMSFRFYGQRDTWQHEGGAAIRTLESFRMREVSALTVPPAYPGTVATVQEAARMLALAEELRAGRVLSQQTLDELEAAIQSLQAIIDRAEGAAEGGPDDAPDGGRAGVPITVLRRRLELRDRRVA